jgi:hypothetical protein
MGVDKTGLALVLISSILLGIWATMNTIALRNVLIWVGSLIALVYWWNWFKTNKANHTLPSLSWLYWLPVVLIGLMFIWVVMHYILFSQNPQLQFSELKSTWLRSFLAVILGSATGLALNRSPRFMPWLWLGLLLSFIVLIHQYIPKAIAKQSLFAVDWFGDYIFWAKFNGVLAGTILIAGLLGLLIDSIWLNKSKGKGVAVTTNPNANSSASLIENANCNFDVNADQKMTSQSNRTVIKPGLFSLIAIPIYVFVGICLTAYAFVFIFDAKAGVGMAFILITFWLGIGLLFILKNATSEQDIKHRRSFLMKSLIVFFLAVTSLSWFTAKHIKNNPGWGSLFEDMAMGAQIEKYPNWKDYIGLGEPLREDGSKVEGSAYVRVAWARVGLEVIRENPVGAGVFRYFHIQVKDRAPKMGDLAVYTHSAWIDIGLAFGIPGLLFMPIALLALLFCAAMNPQIRFRATIITMVVAVLILYLVGEYAFQHGVEILFYLAGLLCGLALLDYSKPRSLHA